MAVREIVAEKMLSDKGTRDVVVTVAKEGMSTARMILKGIGITIIAGIGCYFAYKGVKSIANSIAKNRDLKSVTGNYDESKITLKPTDLAAMVKKIYAAFVDGVGGNYDEDAIIEVLNRVTCPEDWYALYDAFGHKPVNRDGTGETQDLIWFLNDDTTGWVNKKDYAKVLADKGVPNALGSLNGKKRKKKKGLFKKLLNPATPFKAVAKGTKAVNKAVKKKGVKALLNPGTGFKIVQKSIK